MKKDIISVGMHFKSTTFFTMGKITAIRKEKDEIEILFTPSDGNAWVEKSWSLSTVLKRFETGEYYQDNPSAVVISVI